MGRAVLKCSIWLNQNIVLNLKCCSSFCLFIKKKKTEETIQMKTVIKEGQTYFEIFGLNN